MGEEIIKEIARDCCTSGTTPQTQTTKMEFTPAVPLFNDEQIYKIREEAIQQVMQGGFTGDQPISRQEAEKLVDAFL